MTQVYSIIKTSRHFSDRNSELLHRICVLILDNYVCANDISIPKSHRCDGYWSCGDGSDEDVEHAGCESKMCCV